MSCPPLPGAGPAAIPVSTMSKRSCNTRITPRRQASSGAYPDELQNRSRFPSRVLRVSPRAFRHARARAIIDCGPGIRDDEGQRNVHRARHDCVRLGGLTHHLLRPPRITALGRLAAHGPLKRRPHEGRFAPVRSRYKKENECKTKHWRRARNTALRSSECWESSSSASFCSRCLPHGVRSPCGAHDDRSGVGRDSRPMR